MVVWLTECCRVNVPPSSPTMILITTLLSTFPQGSSVARASPIQRHQHAGVGLHTSQEYTECQAENVSTPPGEFWSLMSLKRELPYPFKDMHQVRRTYKAGFLTSVSSNVYHSLVRSRQNICRPAGIRSSFPRSTDHGPHVL